MKLFFVAFVSALALAAQDPPANPPAKKQTTKAAAKAAPKKADASPPTAIPAEAVLGADGDYHYTDPKGKKWLYRRTPFGVVHLEDTPERDAAKAAAASGAGIKATEDGDIVRFERLGPFGVWKWEKKKSELDETEKAALQNSQAENKTVSKQD